jgi:hypothetical protein
MPTPEERRAVIDGMVEGAVKEGTYWGNPDEPCVGFRKECGQPGTHFYVDPATCEVRNVCLACFDARERELQQLSDATRKYDAEMAAAASIAAAVVGGPGCEDELPPEFSTYK